jgi:hypothetical protein
LGGYQNDWNFRIYRGRYPSVDQRRDAVAARPPLCPEKDFALEMALF